MQEALRIQEAPHWARVCSWGTEVVGEFQPLMELQPGASSKRPGQRLLCSGTLSCFCPRPGQPHHIRPIKVLSPAAWKEAKIPWGKLKSPSLGASRQPCPIRILGKGSSVCMLRYFPQVFWMWTDLATTGLGWPADFLSSSLKLFTRLPQTESTLCYFPDYYFY